MTAFFLGCVIFLIVAWVCLSIEHGKSVGKEILETVEKIFDDDGIKLRKKPFWRRKKK